MGALGHIEIPMRADATENQEALIRAARRLFVERGLDVPLDAVSREAGVSIATLYRRFPDRGALVRAVAVDAMDAVAAAAAEADVRAHGDVRKAWRHFATRIVELRVGILMPMLLASATPALHDAAVREARERAIAAITRIIGAAQKARVLRPDVSTGEVLLSLVIASRPLPVETPQAAGDLGARLLHVMLAGLESTKGELPGSPLSRESIEAILGIPAARGRVSRKR